MPPRRSSLAPKPWKRRSDARPGELRSAALRLFAEKGYGGALVEDIAAAAGVTVGTIYRYFSDKEALFRSLIDWVVTVPLVPATEPMSDPDPEPALLALLSEIWAGSRREPHREMLRVLLAESGNEPALVERYRTLVLAPAEDAIARLVATAGAPDPTGTARATLGAVLGASLLSGAAEPLVPQLAPRDITLVTIARGALHPPATLAPPRAERPSSSRAPTRYSGPESW